MDCLPRNKKADNINRLLHGKRNVQSPKNRATPNIEDENRKMFYIGEKFGMNTCRKKREFIHVLPWNIKLRTVRKVIYFPSLMRKMKCKCMSSQRATLRIGDERERR